MQYLFLIYSDESKEPNPGTKEFDEYLGAYFAYTDDVKKKGIHKDSAALQPVATATTVRVREGKTLATDGPFAETK
ncbi:MAG: YciI family protein, partial [Vicinamibacteria bacterium]